MKYFVKVKCALCNKNGSGVQEILGIAAIFIIAGLVLIPGMKGFAKELLEQLKNWFNDTIAKNIFPTA